MIRIVTGILLLGAMLSKLWMILTTPGAFLPDDHLAALAATSAVVVELVLGVWLLSGRFSELALQVTALLFFIFLGVHAGSLPYTSTCNCFGVVELPRGVVILLDGLILASLLVFSVFPAAPRSAARAQARLLVAGRNAERLGAGFAVCLFGVFCLYGFYSLPGQRLLHSRHAPSVAMRGRGADLGMVAPGERRSFDVRVQNISTRQVKIVGATTSCSCLTIDVLPDHLEAGAEDRVQLSLVFPERPGRFEQAVIIYVDAPQLEVTGRIVAHVVGDSPVGESL